LIPSNAGELYSNLHKALLDRGYMLAPSAYEIGFIATVHEEKHILGMVEALDEALGELEW
jgi:glutamate-1-semialdehyde aminotransferase